MKFIGRMFCKYLISLNLDYYLKFRLPFPTCYEAPGTVFQFLLRNNFATWKLQGNFQIRFLLKESIPSGFLTCLSRNVEMRCFLKSMR